MRYTRFFNAPIFILLIAVLLSCSGKHKGFYKVKYPFMDLTISVPNEMVAMEGYANDYSMKEYYTQNIDSTGVVTRGSDPSKAATTNSAENAKEIMKNPKQLMVRFVRAGQWNLSGNASLWANYQDTVVEYDLQRVKTKEFREIYFQERDYLPSAWVTSGKNSTFEEITKNGQRLIKIKNDHGGIGYAGMVGKYWIVIDFPGGDDEEVLQYEKMWEQSYFD